ncbi:MAG TPA: heavy-metal-associated domain-containing protein [Candidatus Binataceae bacterium]|nr:heavy-metal-associated domain-containing protein [Candidatus Binataceae bacterium]
MSFEVIGDLRLNCEKCAQRVTRLLAPLHGVRKVRAQTLNQRIEVLIDTTAVEPATIA